MCDSHSCLVPKFRVIFLQSSFYCHTSIITPFTHTTHHYLGRPEELDEAVRRRFVKRIYIPLPDSTSRRQLLTMLLSECAHSVGESMEELVARTEGYSGNACLCSYVRCKAVFKAV